MSTHSAEERRALTYGDCESAGYGYLRRVLHDAPDSQLRPIVRYPDFNRFGNTVLPWTRWREDPRVLVGIELSDADALPKSIEARRASGDTATAWTFRTVLDFDTFDGARVTLAAPAAHSDVISATLYELPDRRTVLRRWTTPVDAGTSLVELEATPPIRGFSVSRGGMDFLLEIDRPAVAVAATVRTIDLSGFTVVHRSGGCFTAVAGSVWSDPIDGSAWAAWRARLEQRP